MPEEKTVLRLLDDIRYAFNRRYGSGTDSERINRMIAWNSRAAVKRYEEEASRAKNGVAPEDTYIRAYFLMVGTVDIVGTVIMTAPVC